MTFNCVQSTISLLVSLAILVITVIVILLSKQAVCFLKLNKYRSQGIKCYFDPLLGIKKAIPEGIIFYDWRKKILEKVGDSDIVAGNSMIRLEPHIYITGTKLLRDFLLLENENFKRTNVAEETHPDKSFVFENGALGIKLRSIFTGFFRAENIKKIIPQIEAIFEESFKNLAIELFKDLIKLNERGEIVLRKGVSRRTLRWKKVDFKPYLKEPFDKMINVVLFG